MFVSFVFAFACYIMTLLTLHSLPKETLHMKINQSTGGLVFFNYNIDYDQGHLIIPNKL